MSASRRIPGESFLRAICVASAILVGSPGQAQEWPQYRGPDSNARVTVEKVFEEGFGLSVAWKRSLGSGYSGIAVAEGSLVTLFSDGTSDVVIALDPETGDERWRFAVGATYRGHDGSHDGPMSTPLIARGRVFVLGAQGQFIALELASGKLLWSHHLADDLGVPAPYYGFASSPIFEAGRVLLQVGGDVGTLAAFDPATGDLEWTAGADEVQYQTPAIGNDGDRRVVLVAGGPRVLAVDPRNGEVRWEHEHGSWGNLGAGSMTPLPAGNDAYFLQHSANGSRLFDVQRDADTPTTEVRWETRSIRNTYNTPVYHDGHVYAFSSRFLTAVDATTGTETRKSRSPGDGFLILVDGHLVILTKDGKVAVGPATPAGFDVVAEVEVFKDLAWTPPAFAQGSIFVRSLGEIARVDIASTQATEADASEPTGLLAALKASLENSENPTHTLDRFLQAHPGRPILDDGLVHFVYRGTATDVAVGGDLFGARREQPMTRLGSTDLFYYTTRVAPGTRFNYLFIVDYKTILDPENPRRATSVFLNRELEPAYRNEPIEMSWAATPPWSAPAHLDPIPVDGRRGRLIVHEIEVPAAAAPAGNEAPQAAKLTVWLPAGYDQSDQRYPVVYVDGPGALQWGDWPLALEHLVGGRTEEVIVVFADWPGMPHAEYGSLLGAYKSFYVEGVFPFVDGNYRTEPRARRRALVGMGLRGFPVLALAIENQDIVGRVGVQSAFVYSPGLGGLEGVLGTIERRDLEIYLDWATHDLRNPHENWDIGAANRRISEALKEEGFSVSGGEVADGLGWSNWRQRTDALLEALFPAVPPKATGPLSMHEERFQGDWKAYEFESDKLEYALTFEGRDFRGRARPDDKDSDKRYEGYVVIHTDTEPAQIDFVHVASGESGTRISSGIFVFDGETVLVKAPAPGASRPRDFKKVEQNKPVAFLRLSRD